ncbi:MAG: alpha/beta fold hydrolase [Pseudomonas sp.]|uniref:alpha/beta hydrolase family protein n=1 Tax=Pseudomonas sp. TaxID=306 RepID=UPI00299D974A|nr:alpha/beta fold hydrolase [Pseudomonas sp.]MDX1722656.1 alpha/beta fold hydrolase [Pseudomonas sp.]
MKPEHAPHREELSLNAGDGYPLRATLYHAAEPRARLLIGGATGVPQGFYRRFAEYAARQGFTTLSVDYRGIGQSKQGSLRGFKMQYLDWAWHDLAAALDHLHQPDLPTYMIGHSFGGHAFGLLPRHERVAGFFTFGTGAGWHGWMPLVERLRVQLMWNLIGPLIVKRKGYLAWSKLGMGEDLPLGVYQQWKHWCRFPRYFFDDPEQTGMAERFASVRTPIVAANALDDLWAPPASRDAFMAHYRNAPYQPRTIDSRAEGLGAIGHMGYFRSSSQPLWDEALSWFISLSSQRQVA